MQPQITAAARGPAVRLFAIVTAIATALALALVASPATAQDEDGEVTPARVSGADRYATAAEIARLTFPDGADGAVLATGQDFPDALAASFAAGNEDAPILMTARASLPDVTRDALEDLGVEQVFIIGGGAAISADVEAELNDAGYTTHRAAGANRYETAVNVALMFGELGIGEVAGDRTAILASGEEDRFADALSAGPLAASASLPLLLTPTDRPLAVVDEALDTMDIDRVIVVGGTAAVSSAVVQHYTDQGYEMERFAGRNRTETAVVVAQNAIERFAAFDASLILLARGDDYPDALTASIHGAITGSPILLTANPTVLSPATEGYLFDLCPAIDTIRALGGTAAVSEQALNEAVSAAEQCHDPDAVEVTDEEIRDAQGNVLVTIDEFPDTVQPDPDSEFGGPTHFTDAVLSDDGAWLAIGSAGVAHGYGWLYQLQAGEPHLVAFQFEGSVESHSFSPDDRFALFTIATPAETGLLKVVDREDIAEYASDTGFVVEVDEEGDPPFAYEFDEWREPHTLCFTFDGTPYCVNAETEETEHSS